MFNKDWWNLPLQIACGLLMVDVIRMLAAFILRAVAK